jgi:hypothetical protein
MQLGRLEDRVAVEMVRVLEDLVARLLGVLEQRGRVTLGVLGRSSGINPTGGGGGGAGSVGADSPSLGNGGNGGSGVASSITGSSVTRAGGGGGGGTTSAGTASGGGGAGGLSSATAGSGTANTGGGGGGSYDGTSGAGGSGVVIIKIPDNITATFSGGVTSSLSTAVSGFNIYTVTATSTIGETVTFSG